MTALGFWELVVLVFRCIVDEFCDFYASRKSSSPTWSLWNQPFTLLPLEIVAKIVESLPKCDQIDPKESSLALQRTLASCSRSSRALYRYSQRELLRRPYWTQNLAGCERMLLDSPHFLDHIERITIDLRDDDAVLSFESRAAARIVSMMSSSRLRSLGLMNVKGVGAHDLSAIPHLERLHCHAMNSPVYSWHSATPLANLTCLSLSAIHLPHPIGDSIPVSELYTPTMLPNLEAIEIDECCIRIVSKLNSFENLRYLALRCSCTRCIPNLRLYETLLHPLELFELNTHPYFLKFFRNYSSLLPRFKRLRVSSEYLRFRSSKTDIAILEVLIEGLRRDDSSPLQDLIHLYLPKYWLEYDSEEVQGYCAELIELAKSKGVRVDFDVADEGTRMNRAARAACFVSDFWSTVDRLKAREKLEAR
ncbi:uncharacterized protein JCM6883_002778 [Sporobolomyces salmoneus]|uniref:uncharacterized protein n=1 Tax=Sporobolomyces salmoneus TaxID=183962 RepID=UPI00316B4FBA